MAEATDDAVTTNSTPQNCVAFIWALLLLNALAIIIAVPVALGYAQYWLVIWLINTIIAGFILLMAVNQKNNGAQ